MIFSVDYLNGLWKININNSLAENELFDSSLKTLNQNCKIKSVFLNNTVWAFEDIRMFADACVSLRERGFVQD
jgi:hypothetical protein